MIKSYIYILLDANLIAGYYWDKSFNKSSKPASDKIKNIINSVRKGCSPHIKLLTPEICVAEAQTVLSKYANPRWRGMRRKADSPNAIHGRTYGRLVKKMRDDLHGGKLIESLPLQRYHVLAKHLITPIDHNTHLRSNNSNNVVNELGGTDQLICGMAIWLTRLLGKSRLVVFTADYRLAKVLQKAQKTTLIQAQKWGLIEMAEKDIGFTFSKEIYPSAIYLPKAKDSDLRHWLGSWPLPEKKRKQMIKERPVNDKEIGMLICLYKALGVGRDRLPYNNKMSLLTKQFNDSTGHSLNESALWQLLITRLKKGKGSIKRIS